MLLDAQLNFIYKERNWFKNVFSEFSIPRPRLGRAHLRLPFHRSLEMDQAWGIQPTSNNNGGDTPVSILLAGPPDRTVSWYQAVQLDARFRVSSMANDPQDLQAKLAASPEVILLDGTIFAGPAPLVQSLTAMSGAGYLVVPGNIGTEPGSRWA